MNAKIKTFHSHAGLAILVGMDDASNDYLSLKLARPNDYWFHVSGVPGSHVVLRCHDSGAPDRESLEQAAALAAWFSKMRGGGTVSVSYCLARDVSKPRGAKPGSVVIKKAKKLKVRPHLLDEPASE